MWYFVWILGVSFALSVGLLSALWGEHEENRKAAEASDSHAG